jgi:DNA-binding NarL/FixJ family response regulator
MTARERTLTLRVVGDIRDASRSLQAMEERQKGFMGTVKKVGGAIASAYAVSKVVEFGAAVVDLGATVSSFEDTARTVFGNVGEEAIAAAKAAQGIGLSRRQALEQLNYLGNLAQATGATADEALALSEQTIALGADLAAFGDVPTADVLEAISSATRGEYDALQRYLPTVSAASLQEIARAEGLIEEGEALSGAAALQAVYALALRDGGAAIGAYERESDSLQATTQRLRARWENFQTTLGQKVLPLVEKGARFFEEKLVPAIGAVVEFVRKYWPPIYDRYIRPTMESIRELVGSVIGWLVEFWEENGERIIEVVRRWWELISFYVGKVVEVLQGIIEFVSAVFRGDWEAAWDAIVEIAGTIVEFFRDLPGKLLGYVGAIVSAVADIGAQIGKGLVNGIIRMWNAIDPSVSFTVPSWIPGIGGKSWTTGDIVPDLPYLASGGIVTRPTVAVVGEAGPEAVVPLPAAFGNTYRIEVEAGISDPSAVARAVVEAIELFEQQNGLALRGAG